MLSNRFAEEFYAFNIIYIVNLVRTLRFRDEPLTSLSERC
nr:MAG TPA: hypothetical protein [Caudoviricetes sp.]